MDLFSFEGARRIGPENVLMKVSALVDWRRMGTVLDRAKLRSGLGAQGYDLLLLFKCLLLGQWLGLSDPKLEESLKVRLDFMLFAGLDLHASVPDETTHCRFRNTLVEKGVYDDLLAEICRDLPAARRARSEAARGRGRDHRCDADRQRGPAPVPCRGHCRGPGGRQDTAGPAGHPP